MTMNKYSGLAIVLMLISSCMNCVALNYSPALSEYIDHHCDATESVTYLQKAIDELVVFNKDGEKLRTIREIRTWKMAHTEVDDRMRILKEHSDVRQALKLHYIVICPAVEIVLPLKGWLSLSRREERKVVQVMFYETNDLSRWALAQSYYEKLEKGGN